MAAVVWPALAVAGTGSPAPPQEVRLGPCYARFTAGELVVGNAHVERRWQVENGVLRATSFRDQDAGVEWLTRTARRVAPLPARGLPEESRSVAFSASPGLAGPTQAESLRAPLVAEGASARLAYRMQVFPESGGVTMELDTVWKRPAEPGPTPGSDLDLLEDLDLGSPHLRLTQVEFHDQTDVHDQLVFEKEWLLHPAEADLALRGGLFAVEDPLVQAGLVFLKLAPLPHARPLPAEIDLQVSTRGMDLRQAKPGTRPEAWRFTFRGHGAGPEGGAGYRYLVLPYAHGRTGRTLALHGYQRQLRRFDPDRDGKFLSNTWGDRSRDARINAEFVSREIEAAAGLGIDVVQIDDGWQKGKSKNSAAGAGAWDGFWAADPDFWQPDPRRFPRGLAPLVDQAARRGLRLGLWYAPDSSHDFANWERDAARILDLHRGSGIRYFKIDAVKATTKEGERNLHRFLDRVLEESRAQVVFDLDVTAEVRPGYFGAVEAGPIFVENRYTDWHRYWPHHTLRNLWTLSQYVDPLRLRIELLNNARNAELYGDDPLAPARYSPAYLFATAMFANPLGWFEVSNLPSGYRDEVAPLVAVWRKYRREIQAGDTLPFGEMPDGASWTGFVSLGRDRRSGWALVFREATDRAEWSHHLPLLDPGRYRARAVAGAGTARVENGELHVSIPGPRGFVLLRIEPGTD